MRKVILSLLLTSNESFTVNQDFEKTLFAKMDKFGKSYGLTQTARQPDSDRRFTVSNID